MQVDDNELLGWMTIVLGITSQLAQTHTIKLYLPTLEGQCAIYNDSQPFVWSIECEVGHLASQRMTNGRMVGLCMQIVR